MKPHPEILLNEVKTIMRVVVARHPGVKVLQDLTASADEYTSLNEWGIAIGVWEELCLELEERNEPVRADVVEKLQQAARLVGEERLPFVYPDVVPPVLPYEELRAAHAAAAGSMSAAAFAARCRAEKVPLITSYQLIRDLYQLDLHEADAAWNAGV